MTALHITNGDCAANTLRAFLPDPVAITADVLHAGPAPEVDDSTWYGLRAGYLAAGAPDLDVRSALAESDEVIASADRYDEVVRWFEHDLFDQLLLIRTLDRLPAAARHKAWLICIDRYPGVERFIGLGQLSAAQLASLTDSKQRVDRAQFELASRAWQAFRAAEPSELLRLARATETSRLPFLAAALLRFFDEYPSVRNGLSRTGDSTLRSLSAAPLEAAALFARIQADEPSPFMGDLSFFDTLRTMAAARTPLVELMGERVRADLRGCEVRITGAGRDVLSGRVDAIALNGIDEWRGGVHLSGDASSPWRWDGAREVLVSLT